jgi:hypothetical protein
VLDEPAPEPEEPEAEDPEDPDPEDDPPALPPEEAAFSPSADASAGAGIRGCELCGVVAVEREAVDRAVAAWALLSEWPGARA